MIDVKVLTDVFWVAALIAIVVFGTILLQAKLRPSAARWFGYLMCVAFLNIMGVIMTDVIDEDHFLGLRAISLGRAFLPFAMLGFSLAFPYRRRIFASRIALLLLALPSLITVIVTDPSFAPGDITYQLHYHIPWMGCYFLWAYYNLFTSFRRTRLAVTRRQHILLSLASVPTTAMHYVTSILLPALGRNHIWRYNWVPILVFFGGLVVWYIREGLIRRHAILTRFLLTRSIDTAGYSSQIVTHAVKNSLQLIRSLAETAARTDCPDRETRLARIASLCDDLAARMNRLNLLTRAKTGLNLETFRITDPLEEAADRAASRFHAVLFVREYADPVPYVRADRTHLEEVFLNLIVNACEAMPDGGRLRLEVRVENDLVLVGFHDQGVGIDRERLTRIFEPFQTTKLNGGNWGIGLSYCHLVLDRLGGDLVADSTPGRGSSFYAILPAQSAPADRNLGVQPSSLRRVFSRTSGSQ
ncbi:MAG: ATP-binding protein [Bacteroidota bacterium]